MARGTSFRKEQEWRQRLARFRRANLSVVEFCLDEDISQPTFYYWRKRLADQAGSASAAEQAPKLECPRPDLFVPLRLTGASAGGSLITVALRGGTRLEIPLADPSAARTVIAALVAADADQAGGRPC